jgi:hypothetical protein
MDPADLIEHHGFDKDELMAWARERAEELLENVSDEAVSEMLAGMDFDPAPRASDGDEESVTRPVAFAASEDDVEDIEELDMEEVEEIDDEELELIDEGEGEEDASSDYEDVPVRSGQTDVHAAINEPIAEEDDIDDALLGEDGEVDDELEDDVSIPIDLDDDF